MKLLSVLAALLLVLWVPTVSPARSSNTGRTKISAGTKKKRGSGKRVSAAKRHKRASVSARARAKPQKTPTAERYMEIQQALADRGFYGGPINGEWGAEAVAALKRFQEAQNLKPDGRLGALSLISLGLGPKHDAIAVE